VVKVAENISLEESENIYIGISRYRFIPIFLNSNLKNRILD
jgi:hypothetical protein